MEFTKVLLLWDGVESLTADDEDEFSFFTTLDCAAISGKINSVFDGFLELDNLEVDLHFTPFGCKSHRQRMQKENWQDIREH